MTSFLSAVYVCAICTAVYLVGRAVTSGLEWCFDRLLDWASSKGKS